MRDHKLVVRLPLLERELSTEIVSFEIESSYLVSTDGFSFTAYHPDRSILRGLELQPVELILNGASQLLGRIDVSEIGSDGSAVTFRGRDYIADIVEGNIDPGFQVKAKMTVFDAITLALGPYGISKMVSDDDIAMQDIRTGRGIKRRARKFKPPSDMQDYKAKVGEGAYELCNRIAARHGATIQPGPDRETLILSAPQYHQEPSYDLVSGDEPGASGRNNVKDANCTRDYSRFPTTTLLTGRQVSGPGKKAVGGSRTYDMATLAANFNEELASRLSETIVRGRQKIGQSSKQQPLLYRLLHVADEEARTLDELDFAARRAIAERLKDTLQYSCDVSGHVDPRTGAVWSVDTMANVADSVRDVHEPLWIAARKLRLDQSGAVTSLELLRPESFQVTT